MLVMTDSDHAPTTAISNRTYRAEDDISGGESRMLGRLLTPFLAMVPWLLTMGGLWLLASATKSSWEQFETQWGSVGGAVVLFVVAALLWAAVTAWSSVGTTLAGLATLAVGVALNIASVAREIYNFFPNTMGAQVWYFVSPMNFLLVGSLLLAAGLGAAGARRMRR